MSLKIEKLVMGPMENNVYLLADEETRQAVVIDPSFEAEQVLARLAERNWMLKALWVTHPHFDHIAGVATLREAFVPPVPLVMTAEAYSWAQEETQPAPWARDLTPLPPADFPILQGQKLALNRAGQNYIAEIREVPGHCPGSVIYYLPSLACAFVGDAIFHESIGNTSFRGGDFALLEKSIREQIFSLPDRTRLLPGHGVETTVLHEKRHNPYLSA